MTRAVSPRLRVYAALAATGLTVALVAGRPELAVLAAPFALLVAVALAGEPLALEGELRLDKDRVIEGDRVYALLAIHNLGGGARVDVQLPAAARLDSDPTPIGFWLPRGERRELSFGLAARRWGVHDVGPAMVCARDRLGAATIYGPLGGAADLRVYAGVERLRRIIAPVRTRAVLGSQVSRERGEGIEFADLRPMAPGDRARSINWRATARRRTPYVNVHHPEQSADLVVFLDTFAEAELAEEGTLDAAVRAAAGLASTYLARRDRVALVSLGGTLSWLSGSLGTRQLYRILDALFSSEVRPSFRWKGIAHLPRGLLPPWALVIGLSPLPGRARHRRVAESARQGPRPRRPRDLARETRAERRSPAPSLEASARSLALPLGDTGGSGRALGALRDERRVGDRGGDHVTAARTINRARLTTATVAVALTALAGAATAGSPALGATATVLLSLALLAGRATPVTLALLLLGAMYVVPEGDRAIPAPIYAGTLLLIAELSFWSLDERAPGRVEPGTAMPRLLAIVATVAGRHRVGRTGAARRRTWTSPGRRHAPPPASGPSLPSSRSSPGSLAHATHLRDGKTRRACSKTTSRPSGKALFKPMAAFGDAVDQAFSAV